MAGNSVEAVIFDWGGTLTAWHDIDFHAEAVALAHAVREHPEGHEVTAAKLRAATERVWGRSRDEQRSAVIADLFDEAGLEHDPELLTAYYEFWEPHTFTDAAVAPLWAGLRDRGIRIGVLSNTIWPREWHRGFFERDGVLDLIDGDVYTSEIDWTKPSGHAFDAAVEATGVGDPRRCVYVGDRLFDDIWGAQQAGMRAIHIPHSRIPAAQAGHSEGVPDAVVHGLGEIPGVLAGW